VAVLEEEEALRVEGPGEEKWGEAGRVWIQGENVCVQNVERLFPMKSGTPVT